MIASLVNSPKVRQFIDSLPEENPVIKTVRVFAKALLFRKRIYRGTRVVFPGVEDAVRETHLTLGGGRDEITIQTLWTAVSPGTEKAYYLDQPNFHQPRPYTPGYSGCGRVKTAGKSVTGFKRGDMVAGVLKHSGINIVGSETIVPVPADVASRDAAFVTLGVIALAGIRAAALVGGGRVGVLGQGILGQMVNQMARLEGAAGVTALALGDSKKTMAEKSCVDDFIALKTRGRSLSSLKFDAVIDSTGSIGGFESALEMVKFGGRVVMLGSIPKYAEKIDWARLAVKKGIEVRGAHVRNLEAEGLTYRGEAERFLNLLAEQKVKLDHLITDVYKPEDAPEIYRRLAGGDRNMVGIIIDWQSS